MVKQLKFKITYPSINEQTGEIDNNITNVKYFRTTDEVMDFLNIKSINILSKLIKGEYKFKSNNSAYLKYVKIERLNFYYATKPIVEKETVLEDIAKDFLKKIHS